jgi:hypothetical protein
MPTYAIVHATVSGQLRRVIADDEGVVELGFYNDQPAVVCIHQNGNHGYHPLMAGESAIIQQTTTPLAAEHTHHWKRAIKEKIGKEPAEITCALISNRNVVEAIVHADPAVDSSPSDKHLMIECYSPQIIVGCTYDKRTGLFKTMEGLIPVGAPGNDTQVPIVVPPTVIPK